MTHEENDHHHPSMCCGFRSSRLDCLAAAEEKHQQESQSNTKQLSKLKSDQTDMKHVNEDQKRNCLPSPKSLKRKRKPIKKKSSSVSA